MANFFKKPGEKIRIALAGNPNSGKTSIFNLLTKTKQHVGNYPGVTVEKKTGSFHYKEFNIEIVDLPGIYSLTSRSIEERVARDYLFNEKPDLIVNIIDSSNLERNLYLTTQLAELNIPMLLVLNMSDRSKGKGQILDIKLFSTLTNSEIIETVGTKTGSSEGIKAAILKANRGGLLPRKVDYGYEIVPLIERLEEKIKKIKSDELTNYKPRWLALKLLENDNQIINILNKCPDFSEILQLSEKYNMVITKHFGDDTFTILSEKRYGYISGLYHEILMSGPRRTVEASDYIDDIVTHRLVGLPLFFLLMYAVFYLTFTIGEIPMHLIETGIDYLKVFISSVWAENTFPMIRSMVVDGIIGGVGGVLVFLPNILILFLAIAILEDTGYMARAAFIIDRLMHKIGLHGKSFIPMLIGFGCSIPGIMATRTIEDRKDRLTTMMVIPLMSCGARLPIYALIIPAFFPGAWRARVLWFIYMVGIALAVILAKTMKKTIFKGKSTPFVMELPPYRMPTIRGLFSHMVERSWLYIRKAGTIILAISILMWFLTSYPQKKDYDIDKLIVSGRTYTTEQIEKEKKEEALSYSAAGRIGKGLEVIFKPLGFDWKISTALIGAFAAKEIFVAQMGIVYSLGDSKTEEQSLSEKLQKDYSPLTGFCIMLFCLIAAPCMATIAVTRKESGSWKWPALQFFGLTAIAYFLTLFVYQIGRLV